MSAKLDAVKKWLLENCGEYERFYTPSAAADEFDMRHEIQGVKLNACSMWYYVDILGLDKDEEDELEKMMHATADDDFHRYAVKCMQDNTKFRLLAQVHDVLDRMTELWTSPDPAEPPYSCEARDGAVCVAYADDFKARMWTAPGEGYVNGELEIDGMPKVEGSVDAYNDDAEKLVAERLLWRLAGCLVRRPTDTGQGQEGA